MKAQQRAPRPVDRTAWWNKLVSLVACLVVVGTLPVLAGGSDIKIQIGRLLSVLGFAVVLKWGYWRNRR